MLDQQAMQIVRNRLSAERPLRERAFGGELQKSSIRDGQQRTRNFRGLFQSYDISQEFQVSWSESQGLNPSPRDTFFRFTAPTRGQDQQTVCQSTVRFDDARAAPAASN
jgi:hypothetical protein